MTVLETNNLIKIYGSGSNEVRALDGVSIRVEEGEFVAVVGTSGSGKSTLLNMIGGLDRPTSGTVAVRGKELFTMKDEALTIFRRRNIGFVFQNYNLVPVLNVYENIALPIELDGGKPDSQYVGELIRALGLEKNSTICRTTSPAASSSAWRSPAPSRPNQPSSWRMSRPGTSTPRRAWMSCC